MLSLTNQNINTQTKMIRYTPHPPSERSYPHYTQDLQGIEVITQTPPPPPPAVRELHRLECFRETLDPLQAIQQKIREFATKPR